MVSFSSYLFLSVLGPSLGLASASCDVAKLETCATAFQTQLGVPTGSSAFTGVSASGYRARLDTVCRAYDDVFLTCYNKYFDSCSDNNPTTRITFYMNEMFNYQCHTGKEDFIKHANCWIESDVEKETNACVQRYINDQMLAQIVRSGDIQQVCSLVYNALTCAGDVVYNNCGKEAATVYSTISAYAQLMVAQYVSCPNIKNTFGSASNNPYKTGNGPLGTSGSTRNLLQIPVVGMTALVTLMKYAI